LRRALNTSAKRIKQWLGKIFEIAATSKYRLVQANPAKFSTEFLLPDTKQSENHQPSVHYEISTRYMGCYLQQTKQHHAIDCHHKDRSPDRQAR
jgi:hypothetical protein